MKTVIKIKGVVIPVRKIESVHKEISNYPLSDALYTVVVTTDSGNTHTIGFSSLEDCDSYSKKIESEIQNFENEMLYLRRRASS